MHSLFVAAKFNGVGPQACLANVPARIAEHPTSRLDDRPSR
jgi:hypothetical protein